ncbi:MAG: hypothetical protein JSU05_10410 [Bacteroidetes bacterium]|nr:hypothetical protein [Bacteroidota bacterium]
MSIKRYLFSAILFLVSSMAFSQGDSIDPVKNLKAPINRQLFHENIDNEQKGIMASDGTRDELFTVSANEEINFLVTQALIKRVDWLQYSIEKDSLLDHRLKVNYLRGIENLLRFFRQNWRSKLINPTNLPVIITTYEQCMAADRKGETIENIIDAAPYDVGLNVVNAGIFDRNPGYTTSRNILIRKYCGLHPDKIFQTLRENPDVPFRDSLVKVAAYKYTRQLYDYAAASNKLGFAIRKIDDPLVKAVSQMATSNSGQLYLPFLDNIVKGKMTIADINAVKDDSLLYYRLLVHTQMDYATRALNKDTAFEYKALTKMLEKKAVEVFVNTINGLHEENDAVRFKIIQPLTAEELYYLGVLSDGVIYTSSYTKGVYPLMMSRVNNRGDSLLMLMKFDHYRKFIRMAAGYNTLGDFLSTFPSQEDASKLMEAFVGGLEKSDGLEDGVDVADSYASVQETLKPLANEMLENVKRNYQKNLQHNNKRGMVMYDLLNKLFLSADTSNHIDLSREFGIPSVYDVSYSSLAGKNDTVVMETFFYGDEDGRMNWAGFIPQFANNNWKKTEDNKYWVAYASVKGKPILVYANKPLDEESGELDKAQDSLNDYLKKENIHPTIVIHRGHSYWVSTTISYIQPTARIVYLGSCGGYNVINDVLRHAPDAHIVASKQTGKMAINQPFFNLLMEKLRTGNNIDWLPFWQEFKKMANIDGFEDYIPPYKNLGAIFIKAYSKAMGEEGDDENK